ncbi:MAG TPA: cob(I)yrinic acid a,c-diamide adenosyltransferase [Actinobacteria bacterium]|nr:cob(I)yrinic acid a,c-diamide adenosyltransferase [Actinomycetota bacterium]
MVNLTRIYTRTGDDGTTALGDFTRVRKDDSRLEAYADVDEANSAIGVAIAAGELSDEITTLLTRIQNELFDVGADLCTPIVEIPAHPPLRVVQSYVDDLEAACDSYNEQLQPLNSFVLPAGTPAAASLHLARTIVRRAERAAWTAKSDHLDAVNELTATYLNRLSDLLFILARVANNNAGGDVLWQPGSDRAR